MQFDENCHRRVVRDLQRHFHVELRKVGRARNYLVDGGGLRYIVLGGGDYRHGISRAIFDEAEQSGDDTVLVVAVTGAASLDIFVGPFRPLLERKELLPMSEDRYVFHLHRFPSGLTIREIPSLELKRIDAGTPRPTPGTLPRAATTAQPRSGRSVIEVEGNLVRADFRRKKRK